eukprot:TRINITY_DN2313_c0_g1_i3.p1 TRINITY_DN2313_c0_g1~~TRINITY_DN2313_c0_g1_i3.p1  ORF type:complete len:112 (-),score=33.67 TRINITY_DN2313_c0_g1_i3:119-454(-)
MGLSVPKGCALKVNGIAKEWKEKEFLIFDDTFRHEAWNPSHTETRAVLMFDILYEVSEENRNPRFLEKSKAKLQAMGGDKEGKENKSAFLTPALFQGLKALGADIEKAKQQ